MRFMRKSETMIIENDLGSTVKGKKKKKKPGEKKKILPKIYFQMTEYKNNFCKMKMRCDSKI
jgi:hypothetical protein